MKERKVDVAVIGAGTAGLNARRTAERLGASTLLIDPGPWGTTCARTGCMPSKLLIAAAEAAHQAKIAPLFGLSAKVQIHGRQVLRRVQKERDRFVASVMESIRRLERHRKIFRARARFLDAHTLQAGRMRIRAKAFVIATGSLPFIPPPYRDFLSFLSTHDTVFEIKRLPKSLLVAGTGLIGLELGQAFHRLGVRTTLLGRRNVMGMLSDPEITQEALRIFSGQMNLYASHELESIRREKAGLCAVFYDDKGRKHRAVFERVLIAAGRRPNLEGLDLHKAGIRIGLDKRLSIDPQTMRVGRSHIFMAGDAAGERPLLHEASHEGKIAGENAARFPKLRRAARKIPLLIGFTDPQMAVVGKSWRELDCTKVRTGEIDYRTQGRAQIMGINKGKVRIYGDAKTGKILGAEMLGPRVEHTAHWLACAIENQMTVDRFLDLPIYHPVIEEGIQTAMQDLRSRLRASSPAYPSCEDAGPGA